MENWLDTFEVYDISTESKAAMIIDSEKVFREDTDTAPVVIAPGYEYMPWGADNNMPYDIIHLIENDETLTTCMNFNAEICYGGGFEFNTAKCNEVTAGEIRSFTRRNAISKYFLGICNDLKYFAFAVSVIILNKNGKIAKVVRKHAAYCRFAPADKNGKIPYILYGNWSKGCSTKEDVEKIELLDIDCPLEDLEERMSEINKRMNSTKKFAVVTMIPTADSTYYPIPPYASLIRSKWYNIKKLIAIAKEASLKNSAPVKYLIEISQKYFERIFKDAGITEPAMKKERVMREKAKIIDYLTGAENSGKVLFANYKVTPDGKEEHEVKITPIELTKQQGGDWSADMIEAVNMICFAMRVHSNLVGSVPSKSQSNNSGSDKRELYTIAQALQKPYHDLFFFSIPYLIIEINGWEGAEPNCPFIQLTTLDENKDAKEVTLESNNE